MNKLTILWLHWLHAGKHIRKENDWIECNSHELMLTRSVSVIEKKNHEEV